MSDKSYVHGYSHRESTRLHDQAETLADFLHAGTNYPPGSKVLEAGCGVGAQTIILARNSPKAQITSMDISTESLHKAQALITANHITNVKFQLGDIFHLPFEAESFDHIFVCFVLEHLEHPVAALEALSRVLKPNGTMTVIEGDHGSTYFHPESAAARQTIQCLVKLQENMNGNSLIGRQLYPLLIQAGLQDVQVEPKMIYVDSSKPGLVEGFTKRT
ncbi:MAG TPA: class I SAM-dependent methyltransferase, partial [Bacillota bacterium]|nr:class I SAM-dependent methyltransferase [Bacillota bacterium]